VSEDIRYYCSLDCTSWVSYGSRIGSCCYMTTSILISVSGCCYMSDWDSCYLDCFGRGWHVLAVFILGVAMVWFRF